MQETVINKRVHLLQGYLEECFSGLSALKITCSKSEVDSRKFRFTLQFRMASVTTGRRIASSPKPGQRSYKQPIRRESWKHNVTRLVNA